MIDTILSYKCFLLNILFDENSLDGNFYILLCSSDRRDFHSFSLTDVIK
jgi:hypothetical protein